MDTKQKNINKKSRVDVGFQMFICAPDEYLSRADLLTHQKYKVLFSLIKSKLYLLQIMYVSVITKTSPISVDDRS